MFIELISQKKLTEYHIKQILINAKNDSQLVTFINPYSYIKLRSNDLIKNFDYIGFDGIFIVKLWNLFTSDKVDRISFDMTSLAQPVFEFCSELNLRIFFIGAQEEEIKKASKNIVDKFDTLNLVGYKNGYFNNNKERLTTVNMIVKLNPDVIVVGMGTPKQEEFAIELKKSGWKGVAFTCGGFFHQSSGSLIYYPEIINKYNLRSFYRIFNENLYYRIPVYFYFIFVFLLDIIRYKLKFSRKKL